MSPKELRKWVENGAVLAESFGNAEAQRIKQMLSYIDSLENRSDPLVSLPADVSFFTGRLAMYPHNTDNAAVLYKALNMSPTCTKSGSRTIGDLTIKYEVGGPHFGTMV